MDNLKVLAPEDYLMHFGVEGQKWGIRRYQNPDGSLTEAGRKHYGYTGKRYGERVKVNRNLGMKKEEAERQAYKTTNTASKTAQGVRTYVAAGNALSAAGNAITLGKIAASPYFSVTAAGWGLYVGAPAVAAAAIGGYSIYRHLKNRKFQADVKGEAKSILPTSQKKNSN